MGIDFFNSFSRYWRYGNCVKLLVKGSQLILVSRWAHSPWITQYNWIYIYNARVDRVTLTVISLVASTCNYMCLRERKFEIIVFHDCIRVLIGPTSHKGAFTRNFCKSCEDSVYAKNSGSKRPKWPWRSMSMTPLFNTRREYPTMFVVRSWNNGLHCMSKYSYVYLAQIWFQLKSVTSFARKRWSLDVQTDRRTDAGNAETPLAWRAKE